MTNLLVGLRGDDRDQAAGGATRRAGQPSTSAEPHVRRLQEALVELEFFVLSGGAVVNGVFDAPTEWALREFQIAAAMPHAARLWRATGVPAVFTTPATAWPARSTARPARTRCTCTPAA